MNWLGDFRWALPAVIIVGVWAGMPQTTVLLLAGMQSIAPELHEAAAVDGAGALRRFWHVTLPALRPVIIAITTLDFIWQFNSFGLIYVMTEGGPGGRTMIPPLFTYLEAFRNREIGYASALGRPVVGWRSDLRRSGDNEAAPVNLQVQWFLERTGGSITTDLAEAMVLVVTLAGRSR